MSDELGGTMGIEDQDGERVEESARGIEASHHGDALSGMIWPLILIWAGVVFLAGNLGLLERLESSLAGIPGAGASPLGVWSLVFLGAGGIILLEVVLRLVIPTYRRRVGGRLLLAAVFIGLGLGNMANWGVVLAFVLIFLGISMLTRRAFRSR